MKTEIISDIREFRNLKTEWNALLEKSNSYSFFLTWEWLYYWWLHFGQKLELCILRLSDEDSGQTIGIAPFCLQRVKLLRFLPVRKIKFLGTEKVASDFLDFIIYPGREEQVTKSIVECLAQHRDRWDLAEMADIDEHSPTLDLLEKFKTREFRVLGKSSILCPYIQLPETHDSFFASLSPRMRRDLKNKGELLLSEHTAHFSLADGQTTLQADIDELFRLHNARFDFKAGKRKITSGFAGEQFKKFHYELAPELLAQNWLKLYFLHADQKAVACIYAFRFKNRLFAYQSGFDPDWSKLSVGILLFNYMIKDSIREQLAEFHFLRGTETYKAKWTKTARKLRTITWVNQNARGRIFYGFMRFKLIIKTLLIKSGFWKPRIDPDNSDHFPPIHE